MKRVLILTIILESIFFFSSCKKENNDKPLEDNNDKPITENVLYLSKVKMNGKLSFAYIYDDNKLVQRANYYDFNGTIWYYITYEYTSNQKIYKSHVYDYAGKSIGLYVYDYNDQNYMIRYTSYSSDNATTLSGYITYQYNELNQIAKISVYTSTNLMLYYNIFEYNNGSVVKSTYYDGDVLKATVNYTYDNKISPIKYLSNTAIDYGPHNQTEISSSDIISNGGIVNDIGIVKLNFTNSSAPLSFTFTTSVYRYNDDNYPIKRTITYTFNPIYVDIMEFEYIQ